MRELKFRAWDKIGKFYTGNGIGFENHNNRLMLTPTASSRFIIEQYTGLKDKMGKEIYEGDVLLGYYEDFGMPASNKKHYEVKWVEGSAGYNPFITYYTECELFFSIETCEVIGNIHENSDLLK